MELKYEMPEEKYTSDEFMEIFKERSDKLYNDYKNLTVEEARERFRRLFDDIPISISINPYGLRNILENHFPDFHILGENGTKHIFKIPIGEVSIDQEETLLMKVKKMVKKWKRVIVKIIFK